MRTIALVPPRPPRAVQKPEPKVPTCSSCEWPLNATGECKGCT